MGIGQQSCRNDYISQEQSPKRITATLGGQRWNRSRKRGPQGAAGSCIEEPVTRSLGAWGWSQTYSFYVGQPQPHLFPLFLSPLEPNTGPRPWWVEGWIWGEVFLSRTEKSLAFFQEADGSALLLLLALCSFGDTENSAKSPQLHPSESSQRGPPDRASLPAAEKPLRTSVTHSPPRTRPTPLSRHLLPAFPIEESSSKWEPEPEASLQQRF